MSYNPRHSEFPSSIRQSGIGASNAQSSALAARIAAKRQELENLKQLRDLSANLASQMSMLEQKLATLRDGTESVACILANWDNVLRAISMASSKLAKPAPEVPELPTTLVRIPVQSNKKDSG